MQSPDPGAEPPATAKASVFHIQLRSGIWGVKLDGKFYGDYRAHTLAMEGVEEEANALRATGRSVQIVTLSAGGAVLASTLIEPVQPPSVVRSGFA